MIRIIHGNIFSSSCQTIVNTINCVGVMGTGIALEFKLRYPEMYLQYTELCHQKRINIGILWIYKTQDKWILNFPTKYHWKFESRSEYLEKGLLKFVATYKEKGIKSIAFPVLGSSNGGIPEAESLEIMMKHLEPCEIDIEIFRFDPLAKDDLFDNFKRNWNLIPEKDLVNKAGLRIDIIRKVKLAMETSSIRTLSQLVSYNGIGEVTLMKVFKFIRELGNGSSTT